MTVLLVEDENLTASEMKEKLETSGHRVIIADSAENALNTLDGNDPIHLFLVDIGLLSSMDETGLVRQILAHDSPLVFLSSHDESNGIGRTEGVPSYGYVDKDSGTAVLDASLKLAYRLFTEKKARENKETEQRLAQERLHEVIENSLNASYKRNLLTDTYDYM